MNSILIAFIILTVIFPSLTYVVTNNWISTSIVLVATGTYLFLYAYQKVMKTLNSNKRFHSCYSFINSFIISIGVKGSVVAALESSKLTMDKESLDILEGINNLKEEERLDYLKRYYDFDIYYLFLSVIKIWIEQGGDIFELAYYLIDESRRSEDYLIKVENISKRKVMEFSMLWTFTLLIILILRFTLNSFYLQITKLLLFQVSIVALFLLVIVSIHLYISRISLGVIRGYKNA